MVSATARWCDLARHRIVDLLPDREPATVEAWLKAQPEITLISRDRGGGYGQAAATGAPQAVQVADLWHLMENASATVLEAVRRSMRSFREVLNATVITPALLTCSERIRHDGILLRQDNNRTIKALAGTGVSIKKITRQTGCSRQLVRNVLRGGDGHVFRSRNSALEQSRLARGRVGKRMSYSAELWR